MKIINYAQKPRKTRLFLNLTQHKLSVRRGISASTISRNERTSVSPRVSKWMNRKYRQYHMSYKVINFFKDNSVCSFMPQMYYSSADDDKIRHRLTFSFNYVFQYLGRMAFIIASRRFIVIGDERIRNQLIDKRVM